MQDFNGKVAIVTGAGSGLGQVYAHNLSSLGAIVVVSDVSAEKAAVTVERIRETKGEAMAVPGGIATQSDADNIVRMVLGAYGKIDILINASGHNCSGPLMSLEPVEMTEIIQTQLMSCIYATKAVLPEMVKNNKGHIVMTTSGIGIFGAENNAVYAAATAGVAGFLKSVSLEVKNTEIKINAVAPIANTQNSDSFFEAVSGPDPEQYPMELVASAVAFLCHEKCSFSGRILSLTAGRMAQIFSSTVPGYFYAGHDMRDVVNNVDSILSTDHPLVPRDVSDELFLIDI
ncbi:MAG: hypothetical protein COB54_07105 [Alphaproteobacteria bacterium]|nr:MAG: hypothetical protein COB54_07105 [Alphaproteobacteria bacterium]